MFIIGGTGKPTQPLSAITEEQATMFREGFEQAFKTWMALPWIAPRLEFLPGGGFRLKSVEEMNGQPR